MATRYDDLIPKASPAPVAEKQGFFKKLFSKKKEEPVPEVVDIPTPVSSNRYSDLIPAGSSTTPKATTSRYSDLIPAKEVAPVKEKKPSFISKVGQKVADAIDRPENKGKDGTTMMSQLPSSIVESLPFGLGQAFKAIHDIEQYDPEVMKYFDNKDLIKNIPGATLETAKGFVKAPIAGALNIAGIGGKKIKFNIPGLGEVSNAQYNTARRVADGENPVSVALEEGATAILDTLFFASLASKPFVGRPTVTAKSTIPADTYAKSPTAIKEVSPKSFRLYEKKTTSQPLTPEFIEKAKSQGTDFGPNFKPERPTYFRMTFEPKTNSFKGEIVQIKPSWVNTIANKFKGDTAKAPDVAFEVISAPKEVKVTDIENGVKRPIVEDIPREMKPTPPEPPKPVVAPEMPQLTPQERANVLTGKEELPQQTSFDKNDRIKIIDKNTGMSNERTIQKILPDGSLLVFDDISRIPYKASPEKFDFSLVKKGEPDKPPQYKNGESFIDKNDGQKVTIEKVLPNNKYIIKDKEGLNITVSEKYFDEQTIPEKSPEVVKKLEIELQNSYKQYPEAEKELEKILVSLELAEAGKRIFDYTGVGTKVTGIKSTFPEWIPEKLRTKKSLDALREVIKDIGSITYPSRSNAVGKRLLVDEMLNVLDTRLGTDTSGIRKDILKKYGDIGDIEEIDNKSIGESKPAGRGNATGQRVEIQNKKIEELQTEVDRLKTEIETGDTFDGPITPEVIKENEVRIKELETEISNIKAPEKTQKEKVAESVKEAPKSIKEISEETKILEPNVRRILGVGAKDGTFERVDKGVYVLSKNGQDLVWVETNDAMESVKRLASEGFKADMIFLDPPYDLAGNRGGNRMNEKAGTLFETITPDEFGSMMTDFSKILRDENKPIIYMVSQSASSKKGAEKYTQKIVDAGFKPVAKGDYFKMTKDGKRFTMPMRKDFLPPEAIYIFNKSGEMDVSQFGDMQFKLVRPKGWKTEKPAELLKQLINMTTEEGDMILDPFAGSGVTGAEAIKSGRKAYLIEKDPKAVEEFIKPKLEKVEPKIGEKMKLNVILRKIIDGIEGDTFTADRLALISKELKNMDIEDFIANIQKAQDGIEGDNFTWENLETLKKTAQKYATKQIETSEPKKLEVDEQFRIDKRTFEKPNDFIATDLQLRYWGANSSKIKIGEEKYKVHLMSYGDYFLEPVGWQGGERDGFAPGTLWLEKTDPKKDKYTVNKLLSDVTDTTPQENRGPTFTKEEIENWNRNSHFSPDWNKDYQTSLDNVLSEARLETLPEELKPAWDKFIELYTPEYRSWLNTRADNPGPMYTGRANFNYKRSNKLMDREGRIIEKMNNLREYFIREANRYHNIEYKKGGTAEERRQKEREVLDQQIQVGSRIKDFAFGAGTVVRVNTKTYSIKFDSGSTYPREKTFVKPMDDLPKGPGGGVNADIGVFIEGTPVELGNMDKIRPIEFPELVDIARELSKNPPKIKRMAENKGGYFRERDQSITLNADAFKNPEQASKILAHEIGHLIDYLPEGTLARGNIIGRLKTLQGFMGETFGTEKTLMGEVEGKFSDSRRKLIKNKVTKEVLAERGLKFGDMFGNKLSKEERANLNKEISTRTKNAIDEILTKEGFIKNKDIQKELMDASMYWRPLQKREVMTNAEGEIIFDEETGKPKYEIINIPLDKFPKSFQNYRKSSKELYADAISMLFNTPGTLEKMAPTFYKEFFDALDRKPQVSNAYFELQDLLGGDRATLLERRRAGVRGMFKQGDLKASEIQRVRMAKKEAENRDILFHFKFNVIDKNYAMINRLNALKKEGKNVSDDENPLYYLEERNYLGGKIKSFMETNIQPIYEDLQKAGISWVDFGEALFYDRIRAGDRSEVANPRGITPKVADELMTKMFQEMGQEKANILVQKMENYRNAIKSVAEEAFNEGLYKSEMHDKMMENPAYVTFQVLDHLEEGMTSKIHKSIGTLKDVANPADASLLKTISTLRAIERNKVTRSVVEFLQKNFKEDIKDADIVRTPKGKIPKESRLPGEELITYMKDGRVEGFYVDKYIKHSVDNDTIGHTISFLRIMNSNLFRPLFITYNPGFQAFNFLRDFQRFWKNTPTMTIFRALRLYKQAIPVAKARAWGITTNEILQKMERDQILSISYNQLTDGADVESAQIDTILRNSGIDSFVPKVRWKALQPFVKIADFVKNMGDFIETLPKVAGYLEFSKGNTEEITREQKSFIRKNIGSPDFLAGGYWKPITNELFLFSNSITQGIRSDVNVAIDPKTRSGYWYKTAKMNLFPKVLMFLASLGLFGETVKEIMDGASEYDKTNYTIIPLGIDENGKPIYFRMPQDEGGRLIGGLTWKLIDSSKNNQSFGRDVVDIATFTGGQLPNISPTVTTAMATGQFMTGQNPYDWFRNREVLTDDQFKAGGKYALKPFAGWLFNQSGGGIVYRFNTGAPREQSETEKFFNLPIVSNIAGRFIRVSDYGKTEELNKVKAQVQSDQAVRRLEENAIISKYIEEAQGAQTDTSIDKLTAENKKKLVEEVLGGPARTPEEIERANNIVKKYRIGLQRGEADPNVNALISAVTNEEKIALVREMKKVLTVAEYNALRLTVLKNKIATDEVFIKANREEK